MNLKRICENNKVKVSSKEYTLTELIQESYKVVYASRRANNKYLSRLAEEHLINVKADPTNLKKLSRDLNRLKGLYKMGESVVYTTKSKSLKEAKKVSKKKVNAWKENRAVLSKGLKNFRESASNKPFYKSLTKFNNKVAKTNKLTMAESIDLFKASSSAMTQMAIELEHKSAFKPVFKEATKLLMKDLTQLLECISAGKLPGVELVESFGHFSNVLLDSKTIIACDEKDGKKVEEGAEEDALVNTTGEEVDSNKNPLDEDAEEEILIHSEEEFDDDKNPINEEAEADEVADHEGEGFDDNKDVLEEDEELDNEDEEELEEDEEINDELPDDEEEIEEDDELEDEEGEELNEEDEDLEDEEELEEDDELDDEIPSLDEDDELEDELEEDEEVFDDEEDINVEEDLDNVDDELIEDDFEATLEDGSDDELEEDEDIEDEDELEEEDEVDDEELDEDVCPVCGEEDCICEDDELDDEEEIEEDDELEDEEELDEEVDADIVADVDDKGEIDSEKNTLVASKKVRRARRK